MSNQEERPSEEARSSIAPGRLSIPGRDSIAFASTTRVQSHEGEIVLVLRALGFSESMISQVMLVTDETEVKDLGLSLGVIQAAAIVLGVPVDEDDLVVEVAERVQANFAKKNRTRVPAV